MDIISASEDSVINYSYRIQNLFNKMMSNIINRTGADIKTEQLPVIFAVYFNPKITQQVIANYLARDKASITRTVKNIVEKGYLTITSCQHDNRKNCLNLTEKGTEIVELFKNEMTEFEYKIRQNILNQEKHNLIEHDFEVLESICQSYSDSL